MTRPVVFDGGILAAGPWTGVARAFLNGLRAFAKISNRPSVLLLPEGATDPGIDGVTVRDGVSGWLARARRMPRMLAELDAAVLHSPVAALPPRAPCPMVASVHDLPWMARPRVPNDDAGGWRHRLALRHAARRGSALLCVSDTCRDDLRGYLGASTHAAVHIAPNGVEAPDAPAEPGDGPLLVIAADRPRKNLDRVRAAHELAASREPRVPPLRLIGPPHEYVSEAEKLTALRDATALLHVSLFEGFGLPIVEAFAHGVPVVCSDRGALGWVAGDAALITDPCSVEAIADAIVRIATDDALRASLRERGLARATDFTPEHTARCWQRVHEEVVR